MATMELPLRKLTATFATAAAFAVITSASAQEVDLRLPEEFEGLRSAITSASLTLTLGTEEGTLPQDYVAAARADYRRILTALYAFGHYGATVSIKVDGTEAAGISPLVQLSNVEKVEITVTPGPAFRFGQTDIAPLAADTALPDAFASGNIAESGIIKDAAKAAITGWRNEGYAKAGVDGQSIRANHPDSRLDVSIQIGTGPRLSFGDVTVQGNRDVRTERIRAIAGIPEGEVFSPSALNDAAKRLRRSGAFSSVAISEAETISDGAKLGTLIQVDEAPPRRIGAGAELSSTDGLVVNGYWMHRNLLGGAEHLRLEGEISGISLGSGSTLDYRLGYDFLRPQTGPLRSDFYSNGALEVRNDPGYVLKQARGEAGFSRLFGDVLTLSGGLGLSAAEVKDDLGTRRYSVVNAPFTLEWDRRDAPLDAKEGFYLEADLTPFAGFGAVDSGMRAYADARVYRSFGEAERFTLAARAQLGTVTGPKAERTPADYLFYSGGSDTVRGQAYQSLGSTLPNNVKIGGLSLAAASLEARVGITSKVGAVGFFDIGYIGSDPVPLRNGNWHAGTGFGLRYDTGIGPIRFDLATAANGGRFGKELSLYVGIGQAF